MDKQQIVFKHDQLDIDKSTCDDWVNNLITRYENNEINTFASYILRKFQGRWENPPKNFIISLL